MAGAVREGDGKPHKRRAKGAGTPRTKADLSKAGSYKKRALPSSVSSPCGSVRGTMIARSVRGVGDVEGGGGGPLGLRLCSFLSGSVPAPYLCMLKRGLLTPSPKHAHGID
jgi:hypothetical protein